ncbi:hypothetical protein RHAB21_02496 [Pseudorhizobium halotolerans]|uniref:Uncharacterized protein n=1 Tax=Pseudorhizobium halotolerans TaxID=1233081 RepID=A0ABN7JKW2_9HYPH|nr:hypothetical protein [Pseudorhizobium halotolerans]CAD7036208.1 hypothetical protein RHAB21_02496 [Pseudorhizobium halotolerans]
MQDKLQCEGRDLSWIVRFWARIFEFLGKLSLVTLLRKIPIVRRHMGGFIEGYVLFNTALSIIVLAVGSYRSDRDSNIVLIAFALYGAYRIAEMTIYQVNVLLFDEYRSKRRNAPYAVIGFRRMVILLVHNYFEVLCWFGVIYVWLYRAGRLVLLTPAPTFFEMLRESMLLMFSFNAYRYQPSDDLAVVAFSLQALVGLFMTLMVFARFLALLPSPKSMDEFDN